MLNKRGRHPRGRSCSNPTAQVCRVGPALSALEPLGSRSGQGCRGGVGPGASIWRWGGMEAMKTRAKLALLPGQAPHQGEGQHLPGRPLPRSPQKSPGPRHLVPRKPLQTPCESPGHCVAPAPATPTCTPPGPPPAAPALRALPGGGGRDSAGSWEAGRGLRCHSRLGITGLCFLREQNNYNLHRGPELPERSSEAHRQKWKYLLFRVGKEKSQFGACSSRTPFQKGEPTRRVRPWTQGRTTPPQPTSKLHTSFRPQ